MELILIGIIINFRKREVREMKKLAKGFAVVTSIVGVAAVAVGVYEKLTGKDIVEEVKKAFNDFENDDSDYDPDYDDSDDYDDYDEGDDYDEDDFGNWDEAESEASEESEEKKESEDDSMFEPEDEDDYDED